VNDLSLALEVWSPNSLEEFLGFTTGLLLESPLHRRWRLYDVQRLFYPAYQYGQFRCYRHDTRAAGIVTWAYLSDEAADAFTHGSRPLAPSDWRSGGQAWCIDLVAPFGGVWSIAADLRDLHADAGHGFALRRNPDGTVRKRVKLWGGG
jgi:cytolysin-activating lysine-acyltransferase